MVWWHIVIRHCGDQFEMYRNIKSLCCVTGTNSVLGQLYLETNKLIKKGLDLWLSEVEWGGKLDEGSQNVQLVIT